MAVRWEAPAAGRRRRLWVVVGAAAIAVLVAVVVAALRDASGPANSELAVGERASEPVPTEAAVPDRPSNAEPQAPVLVPREPTRRGGRTSTDRPPLTLFVADAFSRVQMIDVVTGDTATVQVLPQPSRTRPRALWTLGDSLILDTVGNVLRLTDATARPALVAQDHRSVPTAGATSLWIYDGVDFVGQDAATGGTVSRVAVDGTVLDRVAVPALAQPIAATQDGIVLRTPGTVLLVGTDGRTRRTVPGWGLASDGDRLARLACSNRACDVVIGSFDEPEQARTPLAPADVPADLSEAPRSRFSPDGRWLALTVHRTRRTGLTDSSRVSVIDVATGEEVLRVGGSPLTEPHTPFAWSADGRWLVLSTGSGLQVWDAGRGEVADLDLRVPPTYALAVR